MIVGHVLKLEYVGFAECEVRSVLPYAFPLNPRLSSTVAWKKNDSTSYLHKASVQTICYVDDIKWRV